MVAIEKLGKPAVVIDCAPFLADSKNSATSAGMPDLKILIISLASTLGRPAADLEKAAEEVAGAIIDALTKEAPVSKAEPPPAPKSAKVFSFTGKDYGKAVENMEKFFLANRWSDGLPTVPPTKEAVETMLKGTNLPRDHVVGIVEPKKGIATVEKIAINAAMAGARPAYLSVIIAVVQALTDPAFDLYGVQCTGGLAAPLLIISGPIIKDLNINFSYSTAGPGWRANSTIGRAMRLILINLGQAWPGVNDMKDFGNPAKFGILIAENEAQTPPGWPPLRVQEGFRPETSTISVYPSQSYRQVGPSRVWMSVLERPLEQLKTSLQTDVTHWGEEVVLALSPTHAEVLAKHGYKPDSLKKDLFEKSRVPRKKFGPRPLGGYGASSGVPKWIDDLPDDGLVPIVPKPEDIKILVAGGRGPGSGVFIDRWGFGESHFVTKEIKLPPNWPDLLKDLQGWETPMEVK